MVGLRVVIIALAFHFASAAGDGCPPLPVRNFQWLNPDGSLVQPQALYDDIPVKLGEGLQGCCAPVCSHKWKHVPMGEASSCYFCPSTDTLICQGNVPDPHSLNCTKLFLYKISGVGLFSLPPRSFEGLSIQNLIIENSNLSYLALETFSGVKSIVSLYLKNNMLDYVPQADYLFQNINDLKFLSLEGSRLKVLSSARSANLHNLTFFSLAGNPLYTMEVFFLQNSGLTFLDLKNTSFKLKNYLIQGSGLSTLPNNLTFVDLSRAKITNKALEKVMNQLKGKNITTLNLNYLHLQFQSLFVLRYMKKTLQYLSLKGNDLFHVFKHKSPKYSVSNDSKFVKMTELNMDNCNISSFDLEIIAYYFPNLKVLSLAGNPIFSLDFSFLVHLPKLEYIDLSNNIIEAVVCNNAQVEIKSLRGADLSHSTFRINEEQSETLFYILKNLNMLSLCGSALTNNHTAKALHNLNALSYLDLSGTFLFQEFGQIFYNLFLLNNITLTELRFAQNNFRLKNDNYFFFSGLSSLEKLDLSNNLIREFSDDMFSSTLRTLNASQNLITTWYFPFLNNESQLQHLDMSNNQITYVSNAMINDFYQLDYLDLHSNPLICHNKLVALVCSNIVDNSTQKFKNETQGMLDITNHSKSIKNNSLILIDWKQYKCYDVLLNGFRQFSEEKDCIEYYEEVSTTHSPQIPTTHNNDQGTTKATQTPARKLASTWDQQTNLIVILVIIVSAVGVIIYTKWWNIKCFFHRHISLKKARLLQKNGNLLYKTEVYYDVFVSYSDVDRPWILDYLVPNMEKDGDVSLCFHERDFQVGMSILENIIDCMDRSRALLLVISSAFVYSKWCQFEMHLAQNRLIETFRDQLVLVLLEDIPRKKRPQTLHHLMTTKTYLMWPQQPSNDDGYEVFWRRLKRALKPNSTI